MAFQVSRFIPLAIFAGIGVGLKWAPLWIIVLSSYIILPMILTYFFGFRFIGLTGGIATGKSTAVSWLKQHNATVIDFDLLAREVVEKGTPTLENIRLVFGDQFITSDGTLDRKKLGDHIFGDATRRKVLDKIIHPAIYKLFIRKAISLFLSGCGTIILDVPLLFETKMNYLCWETVVVATSQEIQIQRLKARDSIDPEAASNRIKSQMPITVKVRKADSVLWNNDSVDHFKSILAKYWSSVHDRLGSSTPSNPLYAQIIRLIPTVPAVLVSFVLLTAIYCSFGLALQMEWLFVITVQYIARILSDQSESQHIQKSAEDVMRSLSNPH